MRTPGHRRIARGVVVACLLVGLAGCVRLPSGPSTAGKLHLFDGTDYTGLFYWYTEGSDDGSYDDNIWKEDPGNEIDDDTSSLLNKSERWVTVYVDDYYQGYDLCLAPRTRVSNMGALLISVNPWLTINNRISSHRWGTSTSPVGGVTACDGVVYDEA